MEKKKRRGWLLLTIATGVFFLAAGIYFYINTIGASKQIEQTLIERYGWATQYTPPADGTLAPERLESFIRVREAVQANCVIFQRILDDIAGLEALEADQDMSAGEKTSKSLGTFKTMFSVAPNFLEFMDARNQALLAEEMGIGEYIYLYVAAHGEQLAIDSDSIYTDREESHISERSRDEFTRILENQLISLETSDPQAVQAELISDLSKEIEALQDGTHSSPWPDGPPDSTRDSLAPYRDRLTALYCTGIVKTELMQKNRGLDFRN